MRHCSGVKRGKKRSGKVLIFLLYTWIGCFMSEEAHVKVGQSRTSCPSRSGRRRVPMHLHTAAAVYKEATRPATERGSTSFSNTPLPPPPPSDAGKRKMKTANKTERSDKLSPKVKNSVCSATRKQVRVLRRVSQKFMIPTWQTSCWFE